MKYCDLFPSAALPIAQRHFNRNKKSRSL